MDIDWTKYVVPKDRPIEIQAAIIVAASNIMASIISERKLVAPSMELAPGGDLESDKHYIAAIKLSLQSAENFADGAARMSPQKES